MKHKAILPAAFALVLGTAGVAQAQSAATTNGPAKGTDATPMTTTPAAPRAPATPMTTAPATPMTTAPATNTSNAPVVSGTNSATNNSVNTAPANNPGAPVAGANSFTEGQARDRIQDKGFAQVTDLKLDGKGVWRGKGMKDGKSVDVSMDYQGNVVPK